MSGAPGGLVEEVPVAVLDPGRLRPAAGDAAVDALEVAAAAAREGLAGRVVWNVNSTARGGGVAEMLPGLLGYARARGIDARWVVVGADGDFFEITKRLHHNLHGAKGDGGPLGASERRRYERASRAALAALSDLVGPRDAVILHDPQTLGLARGVREIAAATVWRSHIGPEGPSALATRAWEFLAPDLEGPDRVVVSRRSYAPPGVASERVRVIPPSIDPLSSKNRDLTPQEVRAILVATGLVQDGPRTGLTSFVHADGSRGEVRRGAVLAGASAPPPADAPLVVQVSRWDPLKDPAGVIAGFRAMTADGRLDGRHLMLAGPDVTAVRDDPEGAATLAGVEAAWRELPERLRERVHLASLPMDDVEENALVVNALQRHAAVIVQKSLREGFGLTVTEGMWKRRPVVASAVGGIRDQIEDGVSGLLLSDPRDPRELASALTRVLTDAPLARRLADAGREHVREHHLPPRHLLSYAALLHELLP